MNKIAILKVKKERFTVISKSYEDLFDVIVDKVDNGSTEGIYRWHDELCEQWFNEYVRPLVGNEEDYPSSTEYDQVFDRVHQNFWNSVRENQYLSNEKVFENIIRDEMKRENYIEKLSFCASEKSFQKNFDNFYKDNSLALKSCDISSVEQLYEAYVDFALEEGEYVMTNSNFKGFEEYVSKHVQDEECLARCHRVIK